jgi:hypothetical protein
MRLLRSVRTENGTPRAFLRRRYRVGLTMHRSLTVYPYEQTSSDPADWSVSCHEETWHVAEQPSEGKECKTIFGKRCHLYWRVAYSS